jgi:uncharacterized protein YjbI with pentapeptide repeats
MTIDRELIARLTQPPMSREDWEAALLAHAEFVRDVKPGWGSRFELLSVSGLPLAVWTGRPSEVGKQLNLNFADLRGLPLEFANLACAAVPGALAEGQSFRGATLTYALLTDARLDGADFSLTKAGDVDFSRASLRGASFRKAVITDADFEDCDLTGADFRGASRLDRIKLKGARLDGVRGLP